jgi:exodeoxyribonuclease VII small subunit
MSFEGNVQRLEEIVAALEHDELPLDRALALFDEGVACLREAAAELARVESAVEVLRENASGVLRTTEFRG